MAKSVYNNNFFLISLDRVHRWYCLYILPRKNVVSLSYDNVIINHTKDAIQMSWPVTNDVATSPEAHLWQGILSNMEGGDKVRVILDFGLPFTVKETVVYLVYGKSIDNQMIVSQPVPDKVPILSGEYQKAIGSKSCCCDDEAGTSYINS
ncbi:TIR-NBS-LRR resistance protein [Quillaja saponaria]|uniref:TIR-NBS-LRR resistance protein n=1 Tax=Quillaja saponaria TaxID=32244 RepID=A0AAD7PMW5_QUISA|nr:TIR-NBS-LRR resistance protein [Quillaja saponaria]